jgi:hypothetical protein
MIKIINRLLSNGGEAHRKKGQKDGRIPHHELIYPVHHKITTQRISTSSTTTTLLLQLAVVVVV